MSAHGRECSSACKARAIPSPLSRGRDWLRNACPWCGARAGEACTVIQIGSPRRLRLRAPHPSRAGVA